MMCRQNTGKTVYAVITTLTEFLILFIEFYFAREQIRRFRNSSRLKKNKNWVGRHAVEYVTQFCHSWNASLLSIFVCVHLFYSVVSGFWVASWYLLSYNGLVQPLNVTEYFIPASYILFASFFNVQDSRHMLLDTGTVSTGVFRGRETNHSSPSRSAVKNEWSYTSIATMS